LLQPRASAANNETESQVPGRIGGFISFPLADKRKLVLANVRVRRFP
jgi:hypothetical protein